MKDIENLSKYVPMEYILWTILVFVVILIAFSRFYPQLKEVFETARKAANDKENIEQLLLQHGEQLKDLSQRIQLINERLSYDKDEISKIEDITMRQQKLIEDGIEEKELIIRSLLGVIQGLQEIGADGPTKAIESEIKEYLVKKSHNHKSHKEINLFKGGDNT